MPIRVNPVWHGITKQEKYSILELPRGNFCKPQWAGQNVKITQMISIFTSKKVWKFWKIYQLTKSDLTNSSRWKMPFPVPDSKPLPRTSSLGKIVLSCWKDSATEISAFYKYFNQSKPMLIYVFRMSEFLSSCLSGKLSNESTIMRKVEVLGFIFEPLFNKLFFMMSSFYVWDKRVIKK